MITFLRQHAHLYALILFWVFATLYLGPLIYVLLPLSMFVLRSRDLWPEMVFGFLIILVFSDISPGYIEMRKIKSAKYAVMVVLSLIFLVETNRFQPISRIFILFLPFFVYAFFPLLLGSDILNGMSKTISYALLYLVVPNYVLYAFRRNGWDFLRNLVFFILTIMLAGYGLQWVNPEWVYVAGRFRGLFGNPNGLGIFSYVSFMLVYLINYLNPSLFTRLERVFVFGVIGFILIKSGSRTSLVATSMFLLFGRFFSLSPFLGFVSFVAFLGVVELVSSNLASIVISLGLEKYFRVETLEDGSGRYFAWNFAWEQINKGGFLIFGGGFGNDEWVMRHNYPYLRSMGHHGGVHNSYLTMWFNTGIVGLLIYFRSYFLLFLKANKQVPIAFAVMFSSLFSVMYESWLTGSLNPFTIILVISMTLLTEPDIMKGGGGYRGGEVDAEEVGSEAAEDGAPATVTA